MFDLLHMLHMGTMVLLGGYVCSVLVLLVVVDYLVPRDLVVLQADHDLFSVSLW